jgi:hypothetical protein
MRVGNPHVIGISTAELVHFYVCQMPLLLALIMALSTLLVTCVTLPNVSAPPTLSTAAETKMAAAIDILLTSSSV